MYAAYQSRQFASRCPLRFPRSPWAAVACGGRAGSGVGLRICVIVARPPERRQVPAEVQFEIARNAVTDTTDLGTARLRTGQGQEWEEQIVARFELASSRRPEPIDLRLRRS
jgi:hypothetical protein